MDDLAARLLVVVVSLFVLLAIAGRRSAAAKAPPAKAATDRTAPAKPGAAERPRWSAWTAVPPDLHETETGRIIALSSVALRAHAAGALVDLRGAVDRNATPDDLVLAALEEIASPWREWPNQPPPSSEPPTRQTA